MKSIALILIVLVAAAIAAPSAHVIFEDSEASPIAILYPKDDLRAADNFEPDHDAIRRVRRKTTYVTVPAGKGGQPVVLPANPPPPQYQPQEPQNTGFFAGATSAWKDTTGKALSLFTSGNSKSANF